MLVTMMDQAMQRKHGMGLLDYTRQRMSQQQTGIIGAVNKLKRKAGANQNAARTLLGG